MPNRREFLALSALASAAAMLPRLGSATEGGISGEFDIFGIAGQSNATGRGNLAESPIVTSGALECVVPAWVKGKQVTAPYLKALADPVQQNRQQPVEQFGSLLPAFANEYFRLTGRRVVICGGARDGQGLLNAWRLDDYPDRLVEKCNHAKALLSAQGATGMVRGVLWCGGEQDAKTNVTQAVWEDAFARLLTRFRTKFANPNLPLFCVSLDRMTDPAYDAGFAAIRAAQAAVCARTTGLALVTQYRDYAGQRRMWDAIHWNQSALNAVGAEAALNVAASLF